MSTLTPRRRSILVLLAVVLAVATAACGIDDDKVATGATTTEPGTGTTTTKPGGPQISLPDIPKDATSSTVPDPTTTSSVPESEATPNGVTPDDLAQQIVGPNINEDQAQCIANNTFSEFDGATIDEMIAANDLADLGGDIEQRFTDIVKECVGG